MPPSPKLQRTSMTGDNGEEATKFNIKKDEMLYPSSHIETNLSAIAPRSLPTAELLLHQYKLEDKIRRLYQRLQELRGEARNCMQRSQYEGGCMLNGK